MRTLALVSNQAFSLVNFRASLIGSLVARGVKVYALAPDFDEASRREVLQLGAEPVDVSLARVGTNPIRDLADTLRLAKTLKRLAPDVAFGYFVKPVIYGTLAAWLARVPFRVGMIEGLGYAFTEVEGEGRSWKRRSVRVVVQGLYRLALSRADRVIFLNSDDQQEFVESNLVDAQKCRMLGGIGVDLSEWRFTPVPEGRLTFVLVARLLREKGICEFAEAARKVKSRFPETRFLLLGGLDSNPGGVREEEVRAWVREGILEWPGHVPVRPYLEEASVFVLPSFYREGVPRSTQEAMSLGRAVITTDTPGCRETVTDGENGFFVPVRDPEALAERMIEFVNRPELVASMGRASRRMAEEKFDAADSNRRLVEILEARA